MKKARGEIFRVGRDGWWGATMETGPMRLTIFGQHSMEDATSKLLEVAEKVGWELDGPWERT
jgi:hypothetical protein